MAILYFLGNPALTAFQLRKLNERLKHGTVRSARMLMIAHAPDPSRVDTSRLGQLLAAERLPELKFTRDQRVVGPRPGTITPWSSKATDILHRCHIGGVERVEICRLLRLEGSVVDDAPLFDRMTEVLIGSELQMQNVFQEQRPRPLRYVALGDAPVAALEAVNQELGLALNGDEIAYLVNEYRRMQRDPTDAELMMFAQANSEHCRHKIFNASWTIDGIEEQQSLFGMIRESHRCSPGGVLSAYSDNAAVIEGHSGYSFFPDAEGVWGRFDSDLGIMIKVETHNHPTAIAPYPGAATGSGGEIRDEAATGKGAKPKAGLTGFTVSNLRIPESVQPWEGDPMAPSRIASPLEIMVQGPLGGAAFNNEFGRPALGGYFRTFEWTDPRSGNHFGYHKPIMIAGGMGAVRADQVHKERLSPGDHVVVLGGPCMLIGLGGGAASSVSSGESDEGLDFASVQRDNPEMQRRCQEVIDRCAIQGPASPIVSIHDVGAGGLSNAIPELLHDSDRGGCLELREIRSADGGLSPMEIWCNESQERYVVGVHSDRLADFLALCERERCEVAVVGTVTDAEHLRLSDRRLEHSPVDLDMQTLFGKPPKMHRVARRSRSVSGPCEFGRDLSTIIQKVLQLPAVASKKFLITIGDRTVGGMTFRDQMVGPWQVPVADQAITLTDFTSYTGAAMSMGERTPVAVLDAPASGRMAVAEAITNIASAPIGALGNVKLSANWMAAAGDEIGDAALFDTVRAVGAELCPQLGIAIPVGKDSLSMRTSWVDNGTDRTVASPVSLIVSAFSPVRDVRKSVTPELASAGDLWLLDLGCGRQRLGGSALAQVHGQIGDNPPDLDDPELLRRFFVLIQHCLEMGFITAYHDRSDGGVFVTLAEMHIASRRGLTMRIPDDSDPVAFLFAEELGAVVQVDPEHEEAFKASLAEFELEHIASPIARLATHVALTVTQGGSTLYECDRVALEKQWSRTSWQIARIRDNPECADQEYQAIAAGEPGLWSSLAFSIEAPAIATARPRIAVLREQGVNGQVEMAAAFDRAGFTAVDVHMRDLVENASSLRQFAGLAVCGGFSYGDVLGAGRGWAHSILFRDELRRAFADFFAREDRFTLGVCNGCQMLSTLREIIPGTQSWPVFGPNLSARFEARLSMVRIADSPSVLLRGMAGSEIPVAVSHGEGRARFDNDGARTAVLHYLAPGGDVASAYPANPNGSDAGVAGVCSSDGRVTIMMPHPERVFRSAQMSWAPDNWGEDSPWMQMFYNAYRWSAER